MRGREYNRLKGKKKSKAKPPEAKKKSAAMNNDVGRIGETKVIFALFRQQRRFGGLSSLFHLWSWREIGAARPCRSQITKDEEAVPLFILLHTRLPWQSLPVSRGLVVQKRRAKPAQQYPTPHLISVGQQLNRYCMSPSLIESTGQPLAESGAVAGGCLVSLSLSPPSLHNGSSPATSYFMREPLPVAILSLDQTN